MEDNMATYFNNNNKNKIQINSPGDFQNAWDNQYGMNDVDISPRLLATIYTPGNSGDPDYLYPRGFYYAWAFSSSNLALFLELNKRYGANDPTKVTVGIAEIAGFPRLDTYPGGNLAVYTLPDSDTGGQESQVLVPTVETWLRILDDLGSPVPLAVAKELTYLYSNLESNTDVVELYSELSGLSPKTLTSTNYAPVKPNRELAWEKYHITTGRQKKYKEVIQKLGNSPYAGDTVEKVGAVTLACFGRLPGILAGMDPKFDLDWMVMAVRAALAQAQDASALCSLVGVGYNRYPNPFVPKPVSEQTIKERYTGREFILLNRKLEECQEYVSIELKAENKERPYLENGWC
jgi:hypothetical protein